MGVIVDTSIWLTALAIQDGFRLLTANPADFRDVPGLDLIALHAD